MNHEHLMIHIYLIVESAYQRVTQGRNPRRCGEKPQLTDAEIITMEIFGEMQGHHTDAAIWRYFDQHWRPWFPRMVGYKAFAKQCANLAHIKQSIFALLFAPQDDVHITDGVPMPICHMARAHRSRLFKDEAAFGYCAAKDEHYYGFKGHVIINMKQQVMGFTLAPANVDEREVLDNMRGVLCGLLIGDKGLLSKQKQTELAAEGIDLQTPLRDNMVDPRPKSSVRRLLVVRRRVETAIGQLVEFFDFASCKARDMWHLTSRLVRKLLAYNFTLV